MTDLVMYSLDLNIKNGANTPTLGFGKYRMDVTEAEVNRAFKKLLTALRKHAKAKKWKYIVYAATSNTHLSKGGTRGSWHVHVIVFGSPAYTIGTWMINYWGRHFYGLPKCQYLRKCWDGGKFRYIEKQKERTFLQHHGITEDEAKAIGFDGLKGITRKRVRQLFPFYEPHKWLTNKQSGYPFSNIHARDKPYSA